MAKKIKLGLLGCGTVGTGVLKVLQENYHDIRAKIGNDIEVSKVLVRNLNKKRDFNGDVVFTDNIDDILNDESIDIVVELLGGIHPAREYMLKAMENGKHVVTANKDVLAQFGKDMFDAAEKHDVDFMFEASVAGGIPIITPLKQCLTANKITELIGIVNNKDIKKNTLQILNINSIQIHSIELEECKLSIMTKEKVNDKVLEQLHHELIQ